VTDALNKETRYTYDNHDNLIALTDAENNTTRFEYDRNNWLVREIRPEGQQISYDYDVMSLLSPIKGRVKRKNTSPAEKHTCFSFTLQLLSATSLSC
jgi:YD repeat-containing protein